MMTMIIIIVIGRECELEAVGGGNQWEEEGVRKGH
jgi:hypothetical protein